MPVVVVPDSPLRPGMAASLVARVGPVLFRHPSGRPWILGSLDGRKAISARTRDVEVVAIGNDTSGTDDNALAATLAGVRSVAEIDAAGITEGDVLLFARSHDRMRSQPPLFLTRSLCWATVDGVPLISDDQLTLVRLAGLTPDVAVVASRLTDAELCGPFGLRSIWSGLDVPRPGQWLDSRGSNAPQPVGWWRPPQPERSLDDLADELRDALTAALTTRVAGHREVSADLSGGLDSTTLNFVLTEVLGRPHHTFFLATSDAANNDHLWSMRAATELGTFHHAGAYRSMLPHVADAAAGTLESTPEGPSLASVLAAGSVPLIERTLAGSGSTLHLNGNAGDALFGPVSTMVWSYARSGERGRWRRLRRLRLVNRYPLGETVQMLAERGTYRGDLERFAHHDFAAPEKDVATFARWVLLARAHPGLTDAAREHLRDLARRELAEGHDVWSPDRTVHQIVHFLSIHGSEVRRMNQARTPGAGIAFDTPYLDRRVVEASLALRIGDRIRQRPAKPLLAAARPQTMAIDYFLRQDKGDYTAEVFEQHKTLVPLVRELFADGSALEDLGLVDPARIVRSVTEFSVDGTEHRDLNQIVFTERWLRSLPATHAAPGQGARHREGELASSR